MKLEDKVTSKIQQDKDDPFLDARQDRKQEASHLLSLRCFVTVFQGLWSAKALSRFDEYFSFSFLVSTLSPPLLW